jgi:hypothetical protein
MANMKTPAMHAGVPGLLDHACEKMACGEPILKLTQSLLFLLCSVFYHVKPYMKTIGYEIPLLVLYQRGIIALQNGLVTNFSQNEMVWDMNGE